MAAYIRGIPRPLAVLSAGALAALLVGGAWWALNEERGSSPPERLTQSIQLSATHARAGEPIPATLVITNPGATLNISHHGCRPDFAIVLTDGQHPPVVHFLTVCIFGAFQIPHGTSRWPASVSTSQPACEPGGPADGRPVCIGSGQPPLPAGQYQAVLVWEGGVTLPRAKPVSVTLVAG